MENAFNRYAKERPLYEQFVGLVEQRVADACRRAGIPCATEGRAKSLDSFIKKVIRDKSPYEQVYDKAGVRVLPTYPDDRHEIARIVHANFHVTWSKDFVEHVKLDQFGYRGFHFTVELRPGDRTGISDDVAGLCAELQIHTPAEGVWAMVNHDLIYKTLVDVPSSVRRSLNRLSALLELVDLEMISARKQILGQDGAAAAQLLGHLEKHFLALVGRPYDPRLSLKVTGSLLPVVGDVPSFSVRLEKFVVEHRKKLEHIFQEYRRDARHVLLGQPESLLVFFLMDDHRPELEASWPDSVPGEALDALFSIWVPADA